MTREDELREAIPVLSQYMKARERHLELRIAGDKRVMPGGVDVHDLLKRAYRSELKEVLR